MSKAAQNVKVKQSGEVFHRAFPFLTAEEAARLRKTEEDVEVGRIDILELYRAAFGIFKAEQEGRMDKCSHDAMWDFNRP